MMVNPGIQVHEGGSREGNSGALVSSNCIVVLITDWRWIFGSFTGGVGLRDLLLSGQWSLGGPGGPGSNQLGNRRHCQR